MLSLGDAPEPKGEIDVFFVLEEGAPRADVLALMAELRRRGRACDTDYAGRSLKGQLTQAARLGASTIVVVGAGSATIRKSGHADDEVALDEVSAKLST